MTPERKEFAACRPLPPFGKVVAVLIEAFQLTEPASFENPPPPEILEMLRIDGTTLRYAEGDLLKDTTKRAFLQAVADALCRLPWLPFRESSSQAVAALLTAVATHYEYTSDQVANITLVPELFRHNLASILAVDLGVRAGALDVLDGRHVRRESCAESLPWLDEPAAKKWIGTLVAAAGFKRDDFAKAINASESVFDRILGKTPAIPSAVMISRMGKALDAKRPRPDGTSYVTELHRHYAALHLRREIGQSLKLDREFLDEVLKAFTRVRQAVSSFALSLRIGARTLPREVFVQLFLTAGQHPSAQDFWNFLVQAEQGRGTDVFSAHACGTFVHWNEQRHAQLAGWREAGLAARNSSPGEKSHISAQQLSDMLRIFPLIDQAGYLELAGDLAGALQKLEMAASIAPTSASVWHSLGKMYAFNGRQHDAEMALRRSVELDADNSSVVGDLANLLVELKRADEAAGLLERHNLHPNTSGVMAWTWALVELRRGRHEEALAHARSAAAEKFKPGHSNLIASEAARALGRHEEANEHEKRAREMGWSDNRARVFRD